MRKIIFWVIAVVLSAIFASSQNYDTAQNYLRVASNATKPGCSASTRGSIWFTSSALGVADFVEVCRKSALDVYAWTTISLL